MITLSIPASLLYFIAGFATASVLFLIGSAWIVRRGMQKPKTPVDTTKQDYRNN